ncbi:MAG: LysE family translocator [Candidatus Dormibacter sp.]|uniref:LysE family translocator n=1 Tax=Candidatus Dormibacter sp. TaxID=2973982 RepID=UPI003D9B4BF8
MDFIDGRFLAYVAVAGLLIITPGPDMALVSRNALRGGVDAVAPTAFGVGVGILGWAAAAALGVATVLARSATIFTMLRLAGAAYLVVLGTLALRSLLRTRAQGQAVPQPAPTRAGPHLSRRVAFLQGLTGNLLNPKAAVIFLTLVPQFLRPGDGAARTMLMVALFEVMLISWLLVYGRGLAGLGASPLGRRLRRCFETVAGVVLVGLGVRVAWESLRAAP